MGRGRGKGKKLTVIASHEDSGSGDEEHLPAYKRRGRPRKPLKDDIDEEEHEKIVEDGDDVKPTISIKEKKSSSTENEKKRKRHLQLNEKSDSVSEENAAFIISKVEETAKTNGFRQNGSRRKSKPHRAAEAVVPVVAVYRDF